MAAYTTIDDPEAYFQTVLYTGNGSTQSITLPGDTNMQPDMVWIKVRNNTFNHYIFDAPRGVNLYMKPNQTAAEADGDPDHLTAFDSDGFSLGGTAGVNYDTAPFVAWCWKGGTTSGITTTGADITPSAYSFNQTSGVSIIKYTGNGTSGAKIAHGLGAKPAFIVCMNTDTVENRMTFHHKNTSSPETDYLLLNTTAVTTDAARWNDSLPGTVYFEVDDNDAANKSSDVIVAYCFAEKQGFSKCGSYTGNGNADGTFVYTGFKPAWVMFKRTDTTNNWLIFDNKRNGYNDGMEDLQANSTNAENESDRVDFLSNGFKIRKTDIVMNASGGTYIYMAFAEAPFVNSNGVPCNAR